MNKKCEVVHSKRKTNRLQSTKKYSSKPMIKLKVKWTTI